MDELKRRLVRLQRERVALWEKNAALREKNAALRMENSKLVAMRNSQLLKTVLYMDLIRDEGGESFATICIGEHRPLEPFSYELVSNNLLVLPSEETFYLAVSVPACYLGREWSDTDSFEDSISQHPEHFWAIQIAIQVAIKELPVKEKSCIVRFSEKVFEELGVLTDFV